jgi:hypothetical protein
MLMHASGGLVYCISGGKLGIIILELQTKVACELRH